MTYVQLLFAQSLNFDATLSLQTVIGIMVWAVSIVVFMTTVREDLKAIKQWSKKHQEDASKRDEEIHMLGLLTSRLTALMEGVVARLAHIEAIQERRGGD